MEEREKEEMMNMFKSMLEDQTRVIFKRIDVTDATLKPIADIYKSTQGFTNVMKWVFKSLVVPLSVLVGIILTVKHLFYS